MAEFVDPEIELLRQQHRAARATPTYFGRPAPGAEPTFTPGPGSSMGLPSLDLPRPPAEPAPPMAPEPRPSRQLQIAAGIDPGPLPTGPAPRERAIERGLPDSIRGGEYRPQTLPLRGMVDGPGGPVQVGAQFDRDIAIDRSRNQAYDAEAQAFDARTARTDPQRRQIESERLNAQFEDLVAPRRPLMGADGSFSLGEDGTYRNNQDLPRFDRGAVAQARGISDVKLGEQSARRSSYLADAEQEHAAFARRMAQANGNPALQQAVQDRYQQRLEMLKQAYGFGGGLSASSIYRDAI